MSLYLFGSWILILSMLSGNFSHIFDEKSSSNVSKLYQKWSTEGGYQNVKKITNCSHLENLPSYRKKCEEYKINALCGEDRKWGSDSLVPNLNPCEGRLEFIGNYRVCDLDGLVSSGSGRDGCTIISIGGNNLWDFEEAIYNRTDCQIHTFDPKTHGNKGYDGTTKIQPSPTISNRTFFHNFALGSKSVPRNKVILYEDILALANVTAYRPLLILKIDCEGCELHFFPHIVSVQKKQHLLPDQIVTEIHPRKMLNPQVVGGRYLEIYHSLLVNSSFAVFDNRKGDGGCEIGFIRLNDFSNKTTVAKMSSNTVNRPPKY